MALYATCYCECNRCGLHFHAERPGTAMAWTLPENVDDCVAMFVGLGNTAVFSR